MENIEYELMAKLQDEHWWFRARRDVITKVIKSLNLPKDSQILEVGCGMGGNMPMLAEFGELHALDINERAVDYSRDLNIAKEVAKVTIPDENMIFLTGKKFDLIVMFDVLEHIDQPNKCLDALKPLLKANGKLLVTVPAFPFLWSEHDVSQHHKRRYLAKTLTETLAGSGFTTSYVSYYNFFLFPLIATSRGLRKLKKRKNNEVKSDLKETASWLNQLLYKVFSAESKLLPKMKLPVGISLIAVSGCN